MTGLLHRLAARANGSAWTVRSDARLPFASEGWGQAPTEPETSPAVPAALLHPGAAALAAPLHAAETGAATEPFARRHALDAPHLQQKQQHQQQAAGPLPASKPPDPLPSAPATAHKAVQQHPQPLATDTLRSAQPLAGKRTALPQPAPNAPAAPRPAAAPLHAAPALAQDAPEPLLPPLSTHPPGAFAGSPAPREDTEVHIHIGRIDVTAVHEVPKPRPRARERTQPVSLDAYLDARHTK